METPGRTLRSSPRLREPFRGPPEAMSARVSVIIPTYRGFRLWSGPCRASLRVQDANWRSSSSTATPSRPAVSAPGWTDSMTLGSASSRSTIQQASARRSTSGSRRRPATSSSSPTKILRSKRVPRRDGEILRAPHPGAGCATGKVLRYDLAADRETDIIDTTGHTIGRDRRVVDRGGEPEGRGPGTPAKRRSSGSAGPRSLLEERHASRPSGCAASISTRRSICTRTTSISRGGFGSPGGNPVRPECSGFPCANEPRACWNWVRLCCTESSTRTRRASRATCG